MSLLQIPDELKIIPNYVGWKWKQRENKQGEPVLDERGEPKWTKPPYDLKSNGSLRHAASDDPTTWTTFEVAAATDTDGLDPRFDGVGLVLPAGMGGLDLDGVIADDKPEPYALEIIKHLGEPYTEITPSGNGLRAFFHSPTLPTGTEMKFDGEGEHYAVELYFGGRTNKYLTITGNKFSGGRLTTPKDINLVHLLASQFGNDKFKRLWMGDTSMNKNDSSRADLALLGMLARLTNCNPSLMETYFSASALGQRDKWTDRPDYRERTIQKAIKDQATAQMANGTKPTQTITFTTPAVPDPDGDYVIAPAAGQEDGWFPLGDISLIGGASGTGKTTWIFDMLHKQKQGYEVLGHRTFGRFFHVLAYDRRRNANARTMRRLHLLSSDIPLTKPPRAFGVAAVQGIINQIEKMNPTPAVIFIEGLDMLIDDSNKKSVVSPFMDYLQEVAEHFHIALICSVGAPKAKRGEEYAAKRDKLSGSEAWGRSSETVCVLEYAEEDDGTTPQRSLTILPRNASAEKFTLEFQGGRLVPVQPTAEVEVNSHPVGRPNESLQIAIRFLEEQLQDGPRAVTDLLRQADRDEGVKPATFYRAAKTLPILKTKDGWSLIPLNEGST